MSDIIRYFERFSVDDPNKWFRILPVGQFQRFGRNVSIGPSEIADMAENFKAGVPETGAPVNTAHKAEAGKVGDIAALDCRADGLYARINWLDSGLKMITDGAFQYFSPEILWGEIEHEGRKVKNVLMGLALVNDPFFGKATALFSLLDRIEDYREFSPEQRRQLADEGKAMPDGSFPIVTAADLENAVHAWGRSPDAGTKRHIIKRAKALNRTDLLPADWEGSTKESTNMSVADELKGVLESFGIKAQPAPAPAAVDPKETAEYKALADQNKALADKVAADEKAQRIAANVEKFSVALKVDKFETPKGLAEKFAAVAEADAELAEGLAKEFKALIDQAAQGKLFSEFGTNQPGAGGATDGAKFEALARAKSAELKIDISEAFKLVGAENPALYKAYVGESRKRGAGSGK